MMECVMGYLVSTKILLQFRCIGDTLHKADVDGADVTNSIFIEWISHVQAHEWPIGAKPGRVLRRTHTSLSKHQYHGTSYCVFLAPLPIHVGPAT